MIRQRRFILVSTLMVIAVLYLITMQYLWLKNRYENLRADFQRNAKTAVERANSDFQNNYYLNTFDLNIKGKSAETEPGQKLLENFAIMGQVLANTMSSEQAQIPEPSYWQIDTLLRLELNEIGLKDIRYSVQMNRRVDDSLLFQRAMSVPRYGPPIEVSSLRQLEGFSTNLAVSFGEVRPYLMRQLRNQIIPGAILTLLTAFIFWYALRIILQQDRISQLKNDFIGNMTHELKTPIATISAALEAVQHFNFPEEKKAEYLDIARRENLRLAGQVEKVLQIAAFDRDEVVLRKEQLNMHQIIRQCIERISLGLENRNGKLDLQLNAENDRIKGDRVHITNSINNLLDNAMKYSPEDPRLAITTASKNGHFSIAIKDEGMGIPAEHRERIFEKFYRVESGNIHNVKGFGLGLHYVSRIANMHEGNISVQSKAGAGSTFTLLFPTQMS